MEKNAAVCGVRWWPAILKMATGGVECWGVRMRSFSDYDDANVFFSFTCSVGCIASMAEIEEIIDKA